MNITADEYARLNRLKKPVDPEKDQKLKFRAMLHDVVTAEHLTTDEHWNRFLEWVSGARTKVISEADYYRHVLTNSTVVNHDQLIKAKIAVASLEAQRGTLEWIMELPVQLKAGATEVREQLKIVEQENKDEKVG